jgi:hypothetical protein
MLMEIGVRPIAVVPRIATEKSGIEAARGYLARCWFDESKCAEGLKCLDNYRKEWDDERGVWKDRPRHDWASHGYKAFETAAVSRDPFDDDEPGAELDEHGRSEIGGY